jgi:hypothetical protein
VLIYIITFFFCDIFNPSITLDMSRNSFVTALVLYHKALQLPQLHINAPVLPLSTSAERLLAVKIDD